MVVNYVDQGLKFTLVHTESMTKMFKIVYLCSIVSILICYVTFLLFFIDYAKGATTIKIYLLSPKFKNKVTY